ncbi:FAD-dependent oxidoreductase [Candidatus Uhrbacteria bacterium]|nr:FAD-dependent oxidoreductase [Candidatus Uhrbacteria bacterium]
MSARDLIIVGAGVTGSALAWLVTHYMPGIRRILLIERRSAPGLVNSNVTNNSQTLHRGDIETNYPLEKALQVKWGAELLGAFVDQHLPDGRLVIPKQVIAVDDEVETLEARFREFRQHYPDIELLDVDGINRVEPMVMQGRDPDQPIVSLWSPRGHAVDYHALAEKFIELARGNGVEIEILYNTAIDRVEPARDGFVVRANRVAYQTRFVYLAAGNSSLNFAHDLGYERNIALLPVAGSFYKHTRPGGVLRGKVYTMQNPKLPFAAIHGDPAVYNEDETRFGPTARPMPIFERDSWRTFAEFLDVGTMTPRGGVALARILSDPTMLGFGLWNMVYDVPIVGKYAFLRDVRKVVPSLGIDDIILDKGAGGIRGQPIDLVNGVIAKGHDRFVAPDAPYAHTIAPSPGASFCLGNAVELARIISERLGHPFDEARLLADLGLPAI